MGHLVFTARIHSLKRKKSEANIDLMNIQMRKDRLINQIAQAEKARTTRQNAFNSQNRIAQNAIQTIFGLANSQQSFIDSQALSQNSANFSQGFQAIMSWFNQGQNTSGGIKIQFKDGKDAEAAETAIKNFANNYIKRWDVIRAENAVIVTGTSKDNYAMDLNVAHSSFVQTQAENQMGLQMRSRAQQAEIQRMMETSNYFTNTANQVSDFADSANLEELHALELALTHETDTKQDQLKRYDAEIQALEKAQEDAIRKDAPKYV